MACNADAGTLLLSVISVLGFASLLLKTQTAVTDLRLARIAPFKYTATSSLNKLKQKAK